MSDTEKEGLGVDANVTGEDVCGREFTQRVNGAPPDGQCRDPCGCKQEDLASVSLFQPPDEGALARSCTPGHQNQGRPLTDLVENFQVLGENFNPRNAALRRRTTARSRGPAHRSGDSTTHLPQGPTPLVALL